MKMNRLTFLFIICVAIANIALNYAVRAAAQKSGFVYFRALLSYSFIWAFLLGTMSLLLLLRVYSSGIPLAGGIAMMGAISIVGGSLWARVSNNSQLDIAEWLIIGLPLALFVYRIIKAGSA
jgi:hypothetical protein